jgi:hypothetical protein
LARFFGVGTEDGLWIVDLTDMFFDGAGKPFDMAEKTADKGARRVDEAHMVSRVEEEAAFSVDVLEPRDFLLLIENPHRMTRLNSTEMMDYAVEFGARHGNAGAAAHVAFAAADAGIG